ncbi:MAG TPA: RsmE family RNA methyltransferase [Puia sp.]|nr:RsmE family RNA methyltransferase [Puia sp.]
MALPSFYIPSYTAGQQELTLDEDNSRHVVQVLRMKPGEPVLLTDGRGHLLEGEITDAHKKQCRVAIRATQTIAPLSTNVTIAISPLKNASRFEWFLEKATEIGVSTIIPVICDRTERQSIRADRLRNILVSAMLQSQQAWLPVLTEPQPFSQVITQGGSPPAGAQTRNPLPVTRPGDAAGTAAEAAGLRLIAHCLEAPRATASLAGVVRERLIASPATIHPSAPNATIAGPRALILIGPEGDFSAKEVETALAAGYLPVSLGQNRLRTETAGVVAATLLCIK